MTSATLERTPAPALRPSRQAGDPRRFDFVDALRGWAILMVMCLHVGQRTIDMASAHHGIMDLPAWAGQLVAQGWTGVQLFFVTSAFTLFLSLEQRRGRERHWVWAFYLRRLFRIAPMFHLAILLYVVRDGFAPRYWAPEGLQVWHVLMAAGFVHGLHPVALNGVVPGGWSVATEMLFYLTVPLCFVWITNLRRAIVLVLAACGLAAAVPVLIYRPMTQLFPPPEPGHGLCDLAGDFAFSCLPHQLPVFTLGFVAFFLIRGVLLGGRRPEEGKLQAVCLWGVAAILGLGTVYGVPPLRYLPLQPVVYGATFLLAAMGLAYWPTVVVVNPLTRYLGKISYSAYLLHFLVLDSTPWLHHLSEGRSVTFAFVACMAITLAATVVAATATFYLIEQPGISLGKRVIAWIEGRGGVTRAKQGA